MEIKRLRQFRAIVEVGSLIKAAELLHLTPGALSKSLQHLEDELDQSLFNRSGRKLILNEFGTRLYQQSEELIRCHDQLLRSIDASTADSRRQIRLASFEVFTTHLLGQLASQSVFDFDLRVLEMPPDQIGERLLDHSADVGISYAPYPNESLTFKLLSKTNFRIYARKNTFTNTPFMDIPFAIPTSDVRGSTAGLLGIDSWPYERVARHVKFQLTSLESAIALARQGQCAVFIPTFVGELSNRTTAAKYRLVPIPGPSRLPVIEHSIYGIARKNANEQTHVQKFLDRTAELIKAAEQIHMT